MTFLTRASWAIAYSLGLSFQALASSAPADLPPSTHFFMNGVWSGDVRFGNSHAGYGYVDSADTWADADFNFSCSEKATQANLAQLKSPPPPNTGSTAWIHQSLDLQNITVLRNRVFEYLVYEAAALSPADRPVKLNVPVCVAPDSPGPYLLSLLPKHEPTDTEVLGAQNPLQIRLMKFRGVWVQTRPTALAYAILLDDLLKNAEQKNCPDNKPDNSPEVAKESVCFDLRYSRQRLEATYTTLFGRPDSQNAISQIRNAMIKFFGADLIAQQPATQTAPDYSDAAVTTIGSQAYASLTNTKNLSSYQTYLEAASDRAVKLAAPKELRSSFLSLLTTGANLWNQKRGTLQAEADAVCSLDLNSLVSKYQNVVRQTLTDVSADVRSNLKASLCLSDSFKSEQKAFSCSGISGGPLPGANTVTISRERSSYPFGSRNYLTMTQPTSNDPVELHLKVHFNFDADILPAEQTQTLASWQSQAMAWYACQVDSSAPTFTINQAYNIGTAIPFLSQQVCPAGLGMETAAKVKFDIVYTNVSNANPPDGPTVAVHRCYRGETGSIDCQAVRNFAVSDCLGWAKGDSSSILKCQGIQVGDPHNNRANSSNFILSSQIGTILHETGHLFGLNDEYLDSEMPFALIGRPGSVMNDSHQASPRLDWTQIKLMLMPLECGK